MVKQEQKTRNIGIKVNPPKDICNDAKCPFHGTLSLRGRVFRGKVTSDKMHKSVKVRWERQGYIPKYERYQRKLSKVTAHNPSCVNAAMGDEVLIMECRKLSKTKNFVVVEVLE